MSAPSTLSERPHFLSIAPELRNSIYEYYVAVEGGYVYCPRSGKLRCANHEPVDLALMYSCKHVAQEMKGVALCVNPITFSTVSDPELRIRAARFDFLNDLLYREQYRLVGKLSHCLTPDAVQELLNHYPPLSKIPNSLPAGLSCPPNCVRNGIMYQHNVFRDGWRLLQGCVPSVGRKALTFTLQLMADQPSFADEVAEMWHSPDSYPRFGLGGISEPLETLALARRYPPWAIPTDEELDHMARVLGNHVREQKTKKPWAEYWTNYDKANFRFSAAATAISFLASLRQDIRLSIREIYLHEWCRAVAYPESHALGLVPFCQENPLLRIERRVDAWGCMFSSWEEAQLNIQSLQDLEARRRTLPLGPQDVVRGTTRWLVEAYSLEAAGMPAGSLILMIDGEPTPERCSQIFDNVIIRAAAWQHVFNQAVDGFPSPDMIIPELHAEDFPDAVLSLIRGDSMLRCNFYPGTQELFDRELPLAEQDARVKGYRQFAWGQSALPDPPADFKVVGYNGFLNKVIRERFYYVGTVAPLPQWGALLDDLEFGVDTQEEVHTRNPADG